MTYLLCTIESVVHWQFSAYEMGHEVSPRSLVHHPSQVTQPGRTLDVDGSGFRSNVAGPLGLLAYKNLNYGQGSIAKGGTMYIAETTPSSAARTKCNRYGIMCYRYRSDPPTPLSGTKSNCSQLEGGRK